MRLCALHLGDDLSNFWLSSGGETTRFFFMSLFSDKVGDGLAGKLQSRSRARSELAQAYSRFMEEGQTDEAWLELGRLQEELSYPFSYIDRIDQLPEEHFPSPLESGETMHFGESVMSHRWSLPEVAAPSRRLNSLRGVDLLGRSYEYYDPETGQLGDGEGLMADFKILRALLRQLVRASLERHGLEAAGEPLYLVASLPLSSPPLARSLFCRLAREAGFAAVVLRSPAELALLGELGQSPERALVAHIGTTTMSLTVVGSDEARNPALEVRRSDLGERLDRAIETLVQQQICAEEELSGKTPTFDPISRERLTFWKDARLSPLWPRLRDSEAHFNAFQYPFRMRDRLTFRDVRGLLAGSVLEKAVRSTLREPITEALRQFAGILEGRPLSRVVVTGTSSALEGSVELLTQVTSAELGAPRDGVIRISEPLDAVVKGALRLGERLSESDWARIAERQRGWALEDLEDEGALAWLDRWSGDLDESRRREDLSFEAWPS
jgi:hypothetical protein